MKLKLRYQFIFFTWLFFSSLSGKRGITLAGDPIDIECSMRTANLMVKLVFTREQDPEYEKGFIEVLRLYKNNPFFYEWLQHQHLDGKKPDQLLNEYRQNPSSFSLSPTEDSAPSRMVSLLDQDGKQELEAVHPELCKICDWLVQRKMYPREYSWRVMNLRKGDTVVFGDQRFVLGNFLGRGNAKHVWELADRPDAVIHIPFYSGPPAETNSYDRKDLAYFGPKSSRILLEKYLRNAHFYQSLPIKQPRILVEGKFDSFLIASRIYGHQNGRDFLLNEFKNNPENPLVLEKYHQLKKTIYQLRLFIQQKKGPFPSFYYPYRNEEKMLQMEARQFIFESNDWVLVDWD